MLAFYLIAQVSCQFYYSVAIYGSGMCINCTFRENMIQEWGRFLRSKTIDFVPNCYYERPSGT